MLIPNYNFETPTVSTYTFNPSGSSWTWSGNAGIETAGAYGAPVALEGTQAGIFQGVGSASQSVSGWTAGTYVIGFLAVQRATQRQNFSILIDGTSYCNITPQTSTYGVYVTSPFTVTAGAHTVQISALDTVGGDNTAFIDDLTVLPSTSIFSPVTGPASSVIGVPQQFTISLASVAGSSVVFALSSPGFASDTFQTTFQGSSITTVTLPSGSSSVTFWITSASATGVRSITATATGYYSNSYSFNVVSPPAATCQIQSAYVTTSGQALAFLFQTISGSTPVLPTALNYYPTVTVNGSPVLFSQNSWITGYHYSAIIQLANGVQINHGDTVVITTAASWMSCGSSAASNAVTNLTITNYSGASCFGTSSLKKTLQPGFNHSDLGTQNSTRYNVAKNWRFRCANPGGLPSKPSYVFLNMGGSNGIDNTGYLGCVGYWAIGFDDPNYGTANAMQVASSGAILTGIISNDTTQCVVTQIYSNNNPGALGQNQYYLFQVTYASPMTSVNTPLAFQCYNGQSSMSIAMLSNLWIVGPGDFTVPAANNTSWTFDRTNPYALSNMYLGRFPHGFGSARWVDATIGYANYCGMTQPWEQTPLSSLSWNPTYWSSSQTITYTGARPLVPPGTSGSTSYVYSAYLCSQNISGTSTWTCASGLSAAITTTTQTAITINSASADPIFCGVLIQIDSEQMMVQALSGTSAVTVWRGACGTTAATHLNAAPVTILSKRWAWTAISQFSGSNGQVIEFVTANPHGLMDMLKVSLGSGWPTLTCTDSSTVAVNGNTVDNTNRFGPWITGPNTFAVDFNRSSGGYVTLSAPVTGQNISVTNSPSGSLGFPAEFIAMATGQIAGCHLHVNIPLMATDAYVWDFAQKIAANFPAGRRVYVELSDEPWNFWPNGAYWTLIILAQMTGYGNNYYDPLIRRSGQIRSIFQSVFGTGVNGHVASEVYSYLNMQLVAPGTWKIPTTSNYTTALGYAAAIGVPFDAAGAAPYLGGASDSITVGAWNNSATIQQILDIMIHELYYNSQPSGIRNILSAYATVISSYATYTGNPCVFHAYEGGLTDIPSTSMNYSTQLTRDLFRDPLIEVIEQDAYGMYQTSGLSTINLYSYDMYYSGASSWGMYIGISMPYGKGDGITPASNGVVYTNRNYCVTPGHVINWSTGVASTNYDLNTCSVRGQAFNDWMLGTSPGVRYSLPASKGFE